MPKLKIVQDCTGSPDGIAITEYKAGDTVDVTPHLAPILVDAGWATPADDKPKEALTAMNTAAIASRDSVIETKAAPAAPENKAAAQAPENKAKKVK